MSAPLTITVAVGTRPEVIKLAPVVAALRAAGHAVRCVATGQHSDPLLYADLFTELGCTPDAAWLLEGNEGERVGQLLTHAYADLDTYRPDVVLVLGDTYTAPLVALAARRAGVGVVHLEAGLRSFNERSMEESNRRMVAALATLHLAPTELAADFLRREGVPDARIRVVGNPVLDAIVATGVCRRTLAERSGVLLTAHRATNVDDPVRLAELDAVVRGLAARPGGVLFPVHPRTRDRLRAAGRWDELSALPGAQLVDPLPYAAMLRALAACAVAVTDSGGLQEEASYLGVPVVVMRSTTPRWEGVETGAAVLCGLDAGRVLAAVDGRSDPDELARVAALPCPYGDGHTADHVVAALADDHLRALLTPRDPELAAGAPVLVGTSPIASRA
jgi:UDP-N-acetylglucosamine 2-epimerase (non-hydrolysing)